MKNKLKVIFSLSTLLLLFCQCGVNSNVMFKEAKGAVFSDSIPMNPTRAYAISVDDKISFNVSTNNGAKIIEQISGIDKSAIAQTREREYIVRRDGKVELPKIGKVKAEGLTLEQFEDTLVERFSAEYKDPFVQAKITNQRVIVFPGNGSDAKVIPLENTNTTLMEALAQAGGITDRGKANTIKLMRKVNGERTVYRLDLSTIEGLKYVDMIVQANDYIYVEPTPELSKEIAEDVVPIVSIISSGIIIFSAISLLK